MLDRARTSCRALSMPLCSFPTPIGECALAWEEDQLTGFRFLHRPDTQGSPPDWILLLIKRIQLHLVQGGDDFNDVPFAWQSVSEFQRQIYHAALEIKSGQTATYGDLARAIGQPPGASRAVGTALGQNPWPLLVPCHRFIGANGKMTGFSGHGGIQTKLKLLAIEGSELFAE